MLDKGQLNNSKVFCAIPWTSLSVGPNGDVFPCCTAYLDPPLGSLKDSTMREVWNSAETKRIRLNMLSGKKSPQCLRCYEMEDAGIRSPRKDYNQAYIDRHFPLVESTRQDGGVDQLNVVYMDIRFSNLCNFKCRYCNPGLSTAWYSDIQKLMGSPPYPGPLTPTSDPKALMPQVEEIVPHLEMIRFSGGEPLMTPEHYAVLDMLRRAKKTDVHLSYHTNFSTTRHRDMDIFQVWAEFKNVHVAASLDASGPRAEYIRKGQDWKKTVENRERMLRVCPSVEFSIQPTLTVMNALCLPEFHREWLERGLVEPEGMHFNIAFNPEEYCIQIFPRTLKDQVGKLYREHADYLRSRWDERARGAAREFESAVDFMNARDGSSLIEKFRKTTRELDQLREERFSDVFPELSELMGV